MTDSETPDLFERTHARPGDRETSHIAASRKAKTEGGGPTPKNWAGRILRTMQTNWDKADWTADEINHRVASDQHQRFSDLEKWGYIEETGIKRLSNRGSPQDAMRLTAKGQKWGEE